MKKISSIIHYCWFGGNPKPEIVIKCIESWKKYMPHWEIKEWNEQNYDVHKVEFIDEAYKSKKWAFVSDYARFDVLNQYGGIYFDTDVEMLKPVPDEIISMEAFTGVESSGKVSPGLVFAAVKDFPFLNQILNKYDNTHFIINGKENLKTVNEFTTELLSGQGFKENGVFQIIDGLAIYPSEYFCGYDLDVREVKITPNTISVHHYAGTWTNHTLKKKLRKILKNIFGVEGYRNILKIKRKIIDLIK